MSVTSGICCLPDMARVWSSKTPGKPALIDGGRVVTYAQLNDRSNRIANTLVAAGIRPGPRKPVHGERESFISGYGWQRRGPSVGSPGPDVGGGST